MFDVFVVKYVVFEALFVILVVFYRGFTRFCFVFVLSFVIFLVSVLIFVGFTLLLTMFLVFLSFFGLFWGGLVQGFGHFSWHCVILFCPSTCFSVHLTVTFFNPGFGFFWNAFWPILTLELPNPAGWEILKAEVDFGVFTTGFFGAEFFREFFGAMFCDRFLVGAPVIRLGSFRGVLFPAIFGPGILFTVPDFTSVPWCTG